MQWITVIATALVTSVVNFIVMGLGTNALRRSMEKRDQAIEAVQRDLRNLKEQRLVKIEDDLVYASSSRKMLHNEITGIHTKFVHKNECHEAHQELRQDREQFISSVQELARIGQEVKTASAQIADVNDRQIGLMKDLGRLEGSQQ